LYLFILETIGTQELILVGMVALIVFGPRKLPQMAKKAGSFIREMRSVSNDFRSTWEREVSFEDDKSGDSKNIQTNNTILPDPNSGKPPETSETKAVSDAKILPEVREVSEEEFKRLTESKSLEPEASESEKQNWL